jgi:4-hydroxy-tetrahydrodipicolinate reductase
VKIALLGYGKMGKTIEQIAVSRGHTIVLKIDQHTTNYDITQADVAIDFSVPTAAVGNLSNALKNNVPVISGTTGWLQDYDDIIRLCEERDGAFIYASNFSIGVNIFFELNKQLAKMMTQLETYKINIEEIHHTQKLDAPSGTAITLAEGIIENSDYKKWSLDQSDSETLPITSKRIADVPGTHSILYDSLVDSIEIKHTAKNREGFALGAVIAAEWILGKTGIFTMKDVLNIG